MNAVVARQQLAFTQALITVAALQNGTAHGKNQASAGIDKLFAIAYPPPANTPKLKFEKPADIAAFLADRERDLLAFASGAIVSINRTND